MDNDGFFGSSMIFKTIDAKNSHAVVEITKARSCEASTRERMKLNMASKLGGKQASYRKVAPIYLLVQRQGSQVTSRSQAL